MSNVDADSTYWVHVLKLFAADPSTVCSEYIPEIFCRYIDMLVEVRPISTCVVYIEHVL